MPPKLLVDINQLDLNTVADPMDGVRKYNRQRFEMEMLSGVIAFSAEGQYVVAFKDAAMEDVWVRGHIPGRPLMPGVLICECAAQACSYFYGRTAGADRFLGFAGMDAIKFRGQVVPGDRLVMVAKMREIKSRISSFDCQGFVRGQMVFEGVINGIAL